MPLSHYFGGKGQHVMHDMTMRHGPTKGRRLFYATANARRQAPRAGGRRTAGRRSGRS